MWFDEAPPPRTSRHAGLDPASRDFNLLPPSWIPACAGMTTVRYLTYRSNIPKNVVFQIRIKQIFFLKRQHNIIMLLNKVKKSINHPALSFICDKF